MRRGTFASNLQWMWLPVHLNLCFQNSYLPVLSLRRGSRWRIVEVVRKTFKNSCKFRNDLFKMVSTDNEIEKVSTYISKSLLQWSKPQPVIHPTTSSSHVLRRRTRISAAAMPSEDHQRVLYDDHSTMLAPILERAIRYAPADDTRFPRRSSIGVACLGKYQTVHG
jgi:hypothetical protein